MDERERRLRQNEVLFREVNERLEALNEAFNTLTEQVQIVCECADLGCIERIEMTLDEYERLRSDPLTFAVLEGHEAPEVERIVEARAGYDVVRKDVGEGPSIALREDPRGNGR